VADPLAWATARGGGGHPTGGGRWRAARRRAPLGEWARARASRPDADGVVGARERDALAGPLPFLF